ncbi:MAG: hypothetical protein PHH11_09570 [Methylomonas sp.]|nr:hypothetical protein [Methylomonas sp.]
MNKPESNAGGAIESYLSLKVGKADKNGKRSQGHIHYRVLTDPSHQHLYITIVGNDGGGCYSKEIIPFDKVEHCLQGIGAGKPITSKVFQQAFVGKSANNAGFMAAILRAENLLAVIPDATHQLTIKPDWDAWKVALHALIPQAEPYLPEPAKTKGGSISKKETPTDATDQPVNVVQQNEPLSDEPNPSLSETTLSDTTDLDETDMSLLQRSVMGDDTHQQEEAGVDGITVVYKRNAGKQRREKLEHPDARGGQS